jgi:hypothetical protein
MQRKTEEELLKLTKYVQDDDNARQGSERSREGKKVLTIAA